MDRRLSIVGATVLLLVAALPAAAADGCPPAVSGFQPAEVNWAWEPGDPVPAGDLLWETTLAGIAAEGETVEDHLELFGFTTVGELYGFALEGWRSVDRDTDGTVCLKLWPEHQQGMPAYIFNLIDNNAGTSR